MSSTPAMNEVPIENPYPVPAVGSVTIQRSVDQLVGIRLKNLDNKNTVVVTGFTPNSLLHGTHIEPGHEILAINGEAIHDQKQAVEVIGSSTRLDFTTFSSQASRKKSPFCYMEVAPTSKINPGVSFGSNSDRTMVVISTMFCSDVSRTRLRVGDIVLAVNGVPVWKPEQADKEQLAAAQASKALVLYCLDMGALGDYFTTVCNKTHKDRSATFRKIARGHYSVSTYKCYCLAQLNPETMLFEDKTDMANKFKMNHHERTTLQYKSSYQHVCVPTLESLNSMMKKQMLLVKQRVVQEAWDHAVKGTVHTQILPSAPLAPVEISSTEASSVDGSNIPIAAAVLIDGSSNEEIYI